MSGPRYSIKLMKIIWHHTQIDQASAKRFQNVFVVVHTTQKDGLVQQRDAGVDECKAKAFRQPVRRFRRDDSREQP